MTRLEVMKTRTEVNAKRELLNHSYSTDFKDLLSNKEKDYIKWLVEGYEGEVVGLKKEHKKDLFTYIVIVLKEDLNGGVNLPDYDRLPVARVFKMGVDQKDYTGMIYNRLYTLEELGIKLESRKVAKTKIKPCSGKYVANDGFLTSRTC